MSQFWGPPRVTLTEVKVIVHCIYNSGLFVRYISIFGLVLCAAMPSGALECPQNSAQELLLTVL